MACNVSLALKRAGESFPIVWEGRLLPEDFGGENIVFPEPIRFAGEICFDGDALALTGSCEVTMLRHCARCGALTKQSLPLSFTERFVREGLEEESYAFNGESLSLERMFWDGFWLHLTMNALCREDCKGICGICGQNRNSGDCNCDRETPDSKHPFASLRALYEE